MSINSLFASQENTTKLTFIDFLIGPGTAYILFNSIVPGILANIPFTIITSVKIQNGLINLDPPQLLPTLQCSLKINNVNVPYSSPSSITIEIPTVITYTYQCISNIDNPLLFVYWQSQHCQFDNAGGIGTIQIFQ